MFHEPTLSRTATKQPGDERRTEPRLPAQGEVTIRWHLEPPMTMRYELVELSDSGARIRCGMSIPCGAIGTVLKQLPEGTPVNRPVMVQWVGAADDDDRREIGLWFF